MGKPQVIDSFRERIGIKNMQFDCEKYTTTVESDINFR